MVFSIKPVEFYGGVEALKKSKERDARKRKICDDNGILMIEIPYTAFTSKSSKNRIENFFSELSITITRLLQCQIR